MEITKVDVRRSEREGRRIRGYASVTIDNAVAIHDIRILDGDNGLFIAMPSHKIPSGEFKDYVHPINQEVRTMFEKAIFDEYNRVVEEESKEEESKEEE